MNPKYQEQELRALSPCSCCVIQSRRTVGLYEDSAMGLQKLVDIHYMFVY